MKKIFRSRGIRLMKTKFGVDIETKIYYEPNCVNMNNAYLKKYIEEGLISLFEYSELQNGSVDTYNFHVNLNNNYNKLYVNKPLRLMKEIENIPILFDESLKNYTIGYRLDDSDKVVSESYYFYPTVVRDKKIGIKGIVDRNLIRRYANNFASSISTESDVIDEICQFGDLCYKFKGISIHNSRNDISYKLYGRIQMEDLTELLNQRIGYDIGNFNSYGNVVLVAQRIKNKQIAGYNIYFLE